MSVGSIPPVAAVYLSPQAISPLTASTTPIALALAQAPDLSDPKATTITKSDSNKAQQGQSNLLAQQEQLAKTQNQKVNLNEVTPGKKAAETDSTRRVSPASQVDVYA